MQYLLCCFVILIHLKLTGYLFDELVLLSNCLFISSQPLRLQLSAWNAPLSLHASLSGFRSQLKHDILRLISLHKRRTPPSFSKHLPSYFITFTST